MSESNDQSTNETKENVVKTEVVAEVKTEVKTEAKVEVKPEVKTEIKPVEKVEVTEEENDNIGNLKEDEGEDTKVVDAPKSPVKESGQLPATQEGGAANLKVKADEPDIDPEEKKRRVKKLAGAISHSLRSNGEVSIRCFGNPAISKGAKAIAIAKKYVEVQKLQLSCSPAFITTKINDNELTGIRFITFVSEKIMDVDPNKCKSILKVVADKKDIDPEERRNKVRKLAGAIAHSLEENKEVFVRCFGHATIGKASKALAIARGITATRGPDLYCFPTFITANIGGQERTGIGFYAYTNEL